MAYIGSRPDNVVSRQSSKTYRYTATAGQTVFSGADQDNQILAITPSDTEVHMNGLMLDPTDYTLTGTSVTLSTAATAGDELTVTGRQTFEVADTYTKTAADDRYVNTTGDTMTGALALPTGGLTVGTDQLAVDSAGRVTMPYQPAFHVEKENSQTNFGGSGGALVDWTYVHHNVGNHFDLATDVFTAPVSGLYHFNAWTNFRRQAADTMFWRLTVNNTGTSGGWYFYDNVSSGIWKQIVMGVSVKLAANDAVRLYLFANDNTCYMDYSTSANAWNGYSGYLIG